MSLKDYLTIQEIDAENIESHPIQVRSLWLLMGALAMGLNAYFSPLSCTTSFLRPLGEAIPVFHWVASWWAVPPGWKPDFVIIALLSYTS
ncbi:hypothetical protein DSO57_1018883 [Entomophthora muscae]|uniref:Uncharacterized protein n=1 Tax=Entomophthora muscae TaxID=34485 RepID=A0ACC2RVD2_9FUNG|nr:hypothetical protein DSO57_1018883 [Entomophthora muscae]